MIFKHELGISLDQFQKVYALPGFETEESRTRFIEELMKSQKKLRSFSILKSSTTVDSTEKEFHPLKAIVRHFKEGHPDEAVWLTFLSTHFGHDAKDMIECFYGKSGEVLWNWKYVYENADSVQNWMILNEKRFKHLKFGNHRKFEPKNPKNPKSTPTVIKSFVEWVKRSGQGSPYQALRIVSQADTTTERFDRAYHGISFPRFGRTAKFDFLCLLGNLGILEISPPHCYLAEGTGPKKGVLQMVIGKNKGRVTANIEKIIEQLRMKLGIPVEAMEDALCNWQKGRQKK